MKITVHFRGSIGDACLWMTKLKGLFQKHDRDDIYFVLNSRYIMEFTVRLFLCNEQFRRYYVDNVNKVLCIKHYMPAKPGHIQSLTGGCDTYYDFDVWNVDKWHPPVSERYPDLGLDLYPTEITRNRTDMVILHPYGYNIKDTWTRPKWEELAALYRKAGYNTMFMGGYCTTPPLPVDKMIYTIRTARLWVGVDTGTRNLAMIHRTPVVEVGTPGKGDPNFDVFHPKEYRNNSLYFPDVNLLTPEQIFKESNVIL